MSATLPRVGARIKVATITPALDVTTVEGVVTGVERNEDGFEKAYLDRGDGTPPTFVALNSAYGFTVQWRELEPPAPVLPPEPPLYGVVGNDWTASPHELHLRVPTNGGQGAEYYDMLHGPAFSPRSWEQVLKLVDNKPVRWLPAPLLAELTDALRQAALDVHVFCCPPGLDLDDCGRTECEQRLELLVRLEPNPEGTPA